MKPTKKNGHSYTLQLIPETCNLDITVVRTSLTTTSQTQAAFPPFVLSIPTKIDTGLYQLDITFKDSVLRITQMDLVLKNMTGPLLVPKTLVMSANLQEVAQYSSLMKGIFATATGVGFGSALIIGVSAVMWPLVNFQQFIIYLAFINVDYPPQVEIFLNLFDFIGLSFLPNPFASLKRQFHNDMQALTSDPDTTNRYQSPTKFAKYDVTSFFIETGSIHILINLFLLLIILFFKLSQKIIRIKRFMILQRLYIALRWNFMFRIFLESSIPLALSCFLQLRKFSFENAYITLSLLLAISSLVYIILMTNFIFEKLKHSDNDHLKQAKIRKLYHTLYENMALKSCVDKYYSMLILFRGLFLVFLISFFEGCPLCQIIPLILYNAGLVYVVFKKVSFESRSLNIINRFKETCVLVAEICVLCLTRQGESEDYYNKIGWAIVGVLGIVVIIEMVYTLYKTISGAKEFLKKLPETLRESDYLFQGSVLHRRLPMRKFRRPDQEVEQILKGLVSIGTQTNDRCLDAVNCERANTKDEASMSYATEEICLQTTKEQVITSVKVTPLKKILNDCMYVYIMAMHESENFIVYKRR